MLLEDFSISYLQDVSEVLKVSIVFLIIPVGALEAVYYLVFSLPD